MKSLEQTRQLRGRNSGTGIADRDLGGSAIRRRLHFDRDLARKGKLERIGQKIEDDLLPHVPIDEDRLRQWWAGDVEPQAGAIERGTKRRSQACRARCKV